MPLLLIHMWHCVVYTFWVEFTHTLVTLFITSVHWARQGLVWIVIRLIETELPSLWMITLISYVISMYLALIMGPDIVFVSDIEVVLLEH